VKPRSFGGAEKRKGKGQLIPSSFCTLGPTEDQKGSWLRHKCKIAKANLGRFYSTWPEEGKRAPPGGAAKGRAAASPQASTCGGAHARLPIAPALTMDSGSSFPDAQPSGPGWKIAWHAASVAAIFVFWVRQLASCGGLKRSVAQAHPGRSQVTPIWRAKRRRRRRKFGVCAAGRRR
jgi:hypothetical protein